MAVKNRSGSSHNSVSETSRIVRISKFVFNFETHFAFGN